MLWVIAPFKPEPAEAGQEREGEEPDLAVCCGLLRGLGL